VGIEMVLHPDNTKLVDPNKIIEFSKKHNLAIPHLDEFVDSNIKNINFSKDMNSLTDNLYPNYSTDYKFAEKTNNKSRQPIFCPAGWKKINVDFEGNIFTCMSAIDRSKLFHQSAMPHYTPIANIFDKDFELKKEPVICWESFRCSACDYQMLQHAWRPFKNNFNFQLPIVE
jgi:MoaA/NifB/PqqE/SkfB family radical SAM enzyme